MKRLTTPRIFLVVLLAGIATTAMLGVNPLRAVSERLPVGVAMSTSQINCLPWTWFWLENRPPKRLERGDMVQFHARGLQPVVEDGTRLIKIVAGVPGDTFQTTKRGLFINGQWYDEIRASKAIETEEVQTVGPGEFLALGVTDGSFDGRYFGAVNQSELIGTAAPLFAPGWDTDYHAEHDEKLSHRFAVLLDDGGHGLAPRHRVAERRRADRGRR